MKKQFAIFFAALLVSISAFAQPQPPDTLWTKVYGGGGDDQGRCAQPTSDGGYIIAGFTESFGAGGDDVYLIKTDSQGDTIWTRAIGGVDEDRSECVQEAFDKGYIAAGHTYSFGAGNSDAYLIKVDHNGNTVWTHTFGGSENDQFWDIIITTDSCYAIVGYTKSYGDGEEDVWLVKTNSNGDTIWTRTFGGSNMDLAHSVRQTSDGGYIISGLTESMGPPQRNVYIVKTDSEGSEEWNSVFGGNLMDEAFAAQQTHDDGYIVIGHTYLSLPNVDVWLIKTDASGNELWNHNYGHIYYEKAWDGMQTPDFGFIMVGYIRPGGVSWYFTNLLILKTDSLGCSEWALVIAGDSRDIANSIVRTGDGGYIIAGWTASFGAGEEDVWLLRLEGEELPSLQTITLTPYGTGIVIPPNGGYFSYNLNLTKQFTTNYYYST